MRAWVSPPQLRVSHMVQVAASIAQAASTALPPFWKIIAPAVAARGLPVIASHFFACRGGLLVAARVMRDRRAAAGMTRERLRCIEPPLIGGDGIAGAARE